jgi:hypothetical protein
VGWDWVHLVRRPLTGQLYQHWMIGNECGAVGGMRIWRGNRSTRRKPNPVPLCPPRIPHVLTRARTWDPAVGSRRLTIWAMARPWIHLSMWRSSYDCRAQSCLSRHLLLNMNSVFEAWESLRHAEASDKGIVLVEKCTLHVWYQHYLGAVTHSY